MHKRILCLALSLILSIGIVVDVNATTIYDAKNEQKKTEDNLNSVNNRIDSITDRKNELEQELEVMDSQLVEILASISICKDEIIDKEQEVVAAKDDLKRAVEQEALQYEAMKRRMRNIYEQGDNAYFQILFGAESISDMLNKANYVEQFYSYDQELLKGYQDKRQVTQDVKQRLEEEEAELLACNYELELEQQSLELMISEKKESISDFESQLQLAESQAEQYKKDLKKQTEEIRRLEEEEKKAEEAKKAEEEEKKAKEKADNDSENTQETDESANENAEDNVEDNTNNDESESDDENSTEDDSQDNEAESTPPADPGNADLGQQVSDYAVKFVGNPYKYGGTSLTEGTDCSGFTQAVYAHFGISIPRDSTSQRSIGRAVSYAEAQPGDIICYAGHVALYIGGGKIVHASTEATGIKYGEATYRTIITIRRVV